MFDKLAAITLALALATGFVGACLLVGALLGLIFA